MNALRCVVLDANYKADGADYDHGNFDWTDANIPSEELNWLKQDLASAPGPDISVEGERLTFKVTMRFGEQEFPMEFKGRLDGTALKGEFITSRGSREATGKKVD